MKCKYYNDNEVVPVLVEWFTRSSDHAGHSFYKSCAIICGELWISGSTTWVTVCDADPTLIQQWVNVSCPLRGAYQVMCLLFTNSELKTMQNQAAFTVCFHSRQKNEMNRALGHLCAHTG